MFCEVHRVLNKLSVELDNIKCTVLMTIRLWNVPWPWDGETCVRGHSRSLDSVQ